MAAGGEGAGGRSGPNADPLTPCRLSRPLVGFLGVVLLVWPEACAWKAPGRFWVALGFNRRIFGALAYSCPSDRHVWFSAYAYALKHLPITTISLYA